MKKERAINNEIVQEAAAYVAAYLDEHLSKDFCYHDYYHSFCVVNAVNLLCKLMEVRKSDTKILLAAAWFHDTGYTQQSEGHEMISASIAEQFLEQRYVNKTEIELVKKYILATKYPQQPANELEKILCDADMFHLAESNLPERSCQLRKEWEKTRQHVFTDKEWYELNIRFLTTHRFHTAYCCNQLKNGITKNTVFFERKLDEYMNADKKEPLELKERGKEKKLKPAPDQRLERGVETLFKIASGNHMKLSAMADNKAHILLSINSIIISVVLSVLVKNLTKLPFLVLPTILLLGTCIVTIVFAILTTRPKLSEGTFTADQIYNREANLLFFGNFHKMEWKEYEWGIKEIIHDKEYLYKSITKDIYFLGKILAAKYRHLNVGYRIFMYGMIATVLAFVFCFFLSNFMPA